MMNKPVYIIRHAEAEHNIFFRTHGYFPDIIDTKLTQNGINQCKQLDINNIDNIYVSPLYRTLQTASLLFPNNNYIALDELREIDFSHTCNTRSNKSELVNDFKNCNFDMITEKDEIIINYKNANNKKEYNDLIMNNNIKYIINLMNSNRDKTLVFVSHNDYLIKLLNNLNINHITHLKNCEVIQLENI